VLDGEPVKRAKDQSDVIGFESFDNSTCKEISGPVREVVVKRIAVIIYFQAVVIFWVHIIYGGGCVVTCT